MAKNVTSSIRQQITLTGISPADGTPNEIYPKYEVAKISGTNDKLGEIPILYPETKEMYDRFLSDNRAEVPTESTPYLTESNILRILRQRDDIYVGLKDPREPLNDTPDSPSGMVQVNVNTITNEHEINPKVIKEPFPTSTVSPYGPIRESESTSRRKNVYSMYNINSPIISELGSDSRGIIQFSEGNSFIERCIFTGYYKSFVSVKSWKPRQQTKVVNKPFVVENENGIIVGTWADGGITLTSDDKKFSFKLASPPEVDIPHTFISKSGYFFTKRPPIKSMFLGYNDADIVPDSATFWQTPRNGKYNFYNDRICENELNNVIKTTLVSGFVGAEYRAIMEDKEYSMMGKEQVMYSRENDNQNLPQGSYRNLLNSLSKVDIVDVKTIRPGVTGPVLRRRIEQYGPNPLQHLYYMDFFDWRKYTTTYIASDEPTVDILSFKKPIDYLIGKFPLNENRVSFFNNLFNSGLRGRFDVTNVGDAYFFTDTTRILDIYFGLMEMHLKSFSWKDIMRIVDTIPDFRSIWNDPSWEKLSYQEKSIIRFSEIDQQLEPIWQLIKQALDSLNPD